MAGFYFFQRGSGDVGAGLALENPAHFTEEELLHLVPVEWDEHVGHRVLFGIAEECEGLQDMNSAVVSLRVLAVEEVQNLSKAEALSGHVEVYEIALRAATRNCTHFHARNIAQIGDGNFEESDLGKEYRIGVSEEAYLCFSNCGVERVRSLCNQREFRQRMNALEESLLIELDSSKKIQI